VKDDSDPALSGIFCVVILRRDKSGTLYYSS